MAMATGAKNIQAPLVCEGVKTAEHSRRQKKITENANWSDSADASEDLVTLGVKNAANSKWAYLVYRQTEGGRRIL